MDEDEEIPSRSPSPSPPPNGRISVTIRASPPAAAAPPPPPPPPLPPPQTLALALAVQQPHRSSNGREDCWTEEATEVLIEAWGERYLELSRGNLKQQHWKEVADIVNSRHPNKRSPKTDVQCKNRIDTVKKKYKVEKAKIAVGASSNWALFDKLDRLIGANSAKIASSSASKKKKKKKRKVESEDEDEEEEDEEEEEEEEEDEEEDDEFPPPPRRVAVVKREDVGTVVPKERSSMRVLTEAILRFGEVYERAEAAKLAQVVEMEKERMRFAKEVELERMRFFMKTQMEISRLRDRGGRDSGGGSGSNHKHRRRDHRRHDGSNNVLVMMDKIASDSDN